MFKRNITIRTWLFIAILSLLTGVVVEYFVSHTYEEKINIERFNEDLNSQRTELNNILKRCVNDIEKESYGQFVQASFKNLTKKLDGTGYYVFAFRNGNLEYWSDNSFIVNSWEHSNDSLQPVAFVNNTWVVYEKQNIGDVLLIGFIQIKKEFPFENKFLKNSLNPVFGINEDLKVSTIPIDGAYHVLDKDRNFLFSLEPMEGYHLIESHGWLPSFLYALSIIALLIGFSNFMRVVSIKRKNLMLLFFAMILVVIRFGMMYFKFPHVLYALDLFSPDAYASSVILPSLGDVLIDSIILFFLVVLIYREYTTLPDLRSSSRKWKYLLTWIAISYIFSVFNVFIARSLIIDSSISFEIYNLLDINYQSILAFIILTLVFASQFFVFDKTILILRHWFSYRIVFVIFLVLELLTFIGATFYFDWDEYYSIVFVVLSFSLLLYFRHSRKKFGFAKYILLLFLTTVYFTAFTLHFNQVKSLNKRKVIAVGLSNERDLVAEMLIDDLQNKLSEDRIVSELSRKPMDKRTEIFQYLRENYFYGFWSKYDLQATVCSSFDNLKIEQTGEFFGCFSYFNNIATEQGIKIPGTDFYFIDNDNGRISYLGILMFKPKLMDSLFTRLFIELDSRLISQELGYPDLLLDRKMSEANVAKKFSYAKYRNGKLLTRNGSFDYRLSLNTKKVNVGEFYSITYDDYDHLYYNSDKKTTIILSSPSTGFFDVVIAFSYILLLFFILFSSYFIIRNFSFKSIRFQLNIRSRILISFISVLILSFIIIGTGTVFYIISRYEKKNYEIISEKMQSILVELNNKIGNEDRLTVDKSEYLATILTKFSNVFYEDINLYDSKGKLLSTSRAEVFNKGFAGNMMNPYAFYEIVYQHKPECIFEEKIGDLSYLSAYVPYYNSQGKVLAYLNLPYFTRQNTLTREISTFAITLVNIYLILILLAVSFAVFIANSLTKPLVMLQKKFREIELGKKNEPIYYKRMDEIGTLVTEYNRMLEELSTSAEILAKSERETAWREMAKQIAHEIKNPLTPMKLSVQHLLKSYKENTPGWEKHVEKVSSTLIEQIDTLSAIASEFSNFARLPQPIVERINLVEKVKSIVDLYSDNENVKIVLNSHNNDELYVMADKEQLLRIFTNLIKNAIQAIPEERAGLITVETLNYSSMVIVKITDNGTGIPDEVQNKLFVPNFTTKSSGMGLGLAMVKNMVEGMDGEVKYITKANEGTTFFVELPRVK